MIPVYYDLHIHSALSPCAGDDMTPNDIVGMALLNELDLIAITDHNSFTNTRAVVNAAQNANESMNKKLIVLPGAEISTAEEVHVICLFPDLYNSDRFSDEIAPYFSNLPNRHDIFGNQLLFDEKDNIIDSEKRMLIAPTAISFDELFHTVNKHNGAFIPAHIDRSSFSVISNLGFLPPHLNINTIEISPGGIDQGFLTENEDKYKDKKTIFSSDAHQLWMIAEKTNYFMLSEHSAEAAIDFLR